MRPLDPLALELDGTQVIEASAGTGKTHTIGTLWLRLIVERALPVDRILVVTFTRAATAELRLKLRIRLREAMVALEGGRGPDAVDAEVDGSQLLDRLVARWRDDPGTDAACDLLRDALAELDQAAIHTIHGFCQRALMEHAFECRMPFDATFLEDDGPLVEEALADWWVTRLQDAEADVVARFRALFRAPADILPLARRACGVARPRLVGAAAWDHPDVLAETAAARRAAWDEAATAWRAGAAAIARILLDDPGLNRNTYRRATVAGWLAELPGLLEGQPGALPAFAAKLTADALVAGTNKGRTPPVHPFFDACSALITSCAERGAAVDAAAKDLVFDCWEWLGTEIARRKSARSVLAFDDLLDQLDRALGGGVAAGEPVDRGTVEAPDARFGDGLRLAATLRARMPAALIDEFQDTDPVQYRIFRTIYGGDGPDGRPATLLLIGDPKQAIYSFRGADIRTYRDAVGDAGDARWTLGHNWRSDAALIDAVNHLFGRHGRPFLQEWIAFAPIAPKPGHDRDQRVRGRDGTVFTPLELLHFAPPDADEGKAAAKADVDRALPRAIAADIGRLVSSGTVIRCVDGVPGRGDGDVDDEPCEPGWRRVAPGDVAVLVRTNRQAAAMRRALQALGIPNVLQSDHSVFETAEADDMARLLSAMANPTNAVAVRTALATPALGYDAAELVALGGDGAAWDVVGEAFGAWHQAWIDGGFMQAFRRCIEQQQVPARLLARPGGERMLTNLLHLAELLHGASVERRLGPRGLLRWLARARAGDPDMAAGASAQLRLERDAQAVTLVTVHKSKGLEYPIVYCPFGWTSVARRSDSVMFRDPEAGDAPTFSLWPPGAHVDAAEREGLAEDLRLLYVAVTRAQQACRVVWGAFNGADCSALGYLLHAADAPAADDETAWQAACRSAAKDAVTHGPAAARRSIEAVAATSRATADGGEPCVGVRDLSPAGGIPWQGGDERVKPLKALEPPLPRRAAWRSSSYSGLARAADSRGTAAPIRDHDAVDGDGIAAVEAVWSREPVDEGASGIEAAGRSVHLWAEPVPLAAFPAGAHPGERVHGVLETLGFADDDARMSRTIERALSARERADGWQPLLEDAVRATLDTPLDENGLRLRGLANGDRLTEMAFTMPVDQGRAAPATAAALADAMAAAPGPGMPDGYPERLRQLGFAPLSGFLAGFVDLAFRRDGRWYVLDWKTNRLGDCYHHYRRAALDEAMAHHHYVLQYHLYALALHQHLVQRQPGYDYDDHFGGVFYLFLRGLHPELGPTAGVFHDRPPRALVERLGSVVRGAGQGA